MRALRTVLAAATLVLIPVAAPVAAAQPAPGRSSSVLTLVTGDRVHVTTLPDGSANYGIQPAKGREDIEFASMRHGDEDIVLPVDALALIAKGRLDPNLFNVTRLVRDGFGHRAVPIIVSYHGTIDARLAATTGARKLTSINALALAENTGALWPSLTAGTAIKKVWLDAPLHPVLDQSVPQIGAPEAWQAGFTGRDVVLADLDTGWDPAHPDLAGRVVDVRDFIDEGGQAIDGSGHGTHTASTIAGSGAASAGRFTGVAPDAKLIIGKVCDDNGFCPESSIIAGMEWAAGHGVTAVNLSLGSDQPSDGTDPLSQAVNSLTASSGTLFVVAAGNSGGKVGSPAAADLAMTVGSVSKQDQLSFFSSRGPRLGDNAIKPDLTAPGESIVAARAAGTSLGSPVDQFYTRLSGTSMATPHATGVAAILAQKYPDWTPAQLKSAIAGNATPNATLSLHEQGTGRLEVRRLLTKPVHADKASISFGTFQAPFDQPPVTTSLTYRNVTDAAVTLNLTLTPGTQPVPDGMFRLGAPQITVPANGTAVVPVTADPSSRVPGDHTVVLTASSGETIVRTPLAVSLFKKPPTLTTHVIDRHGRPADLALGFAINTTTGNGDFLNINDGLASTELEPGTYDVSVLSRTAGPDGSGPNEMTAVTKQAVVVTADGGETTVDARPAKRVNLRVDRPGATVIEATVTLAQEAGGQGFVSTFFTGRGAQVFAVPSKGRATDRFAYRPALGGTAADGRPFRYELAFTHQGGLPNKPTYYTPDRGLARFDTTYFAQGLAGTSGLEGNNARLAAIPGLSTFKFFDLAMPSERIELYTADPGVEWFTLRVLFGETDGSEAGILTGSLMAGRSKSTWFRPPVSVAWGNPSAFDGLIRDGNRLVLSVPPFAPSDGKRYASGFGAGDPGKTTLSTNGTVIGTTDTAGQGEFTLPSGKARYTLTTSGTRVAPYSNLDTTSVAEWTFNSAATTALTRLPLSLLRLGVGGDARFTDAQNALGQVRAGSNHELTIAADPQPGSAAAATRIPSLEVSYDDGTTWKRLSVGWQQRAQRGNAWLVEPLAPGFVSLRATATNTDGSRVVQTIIRAYELI